MADNKVDAASGGGDGTDGGCSWARARAVKDTIVYYLKRVPLVNFLARATLPCKTDGRVRPYQDALMARARAADKTPNQHDSLLRGFIAARRTPLGVWEVFFFF